MAVELMNISGFLPFRLRFGSRDGLLLHRRLFGGQGMRGHLEAIDTDIVPDGVCVQPATAVNGITGLCPNGRSQGQPNHGTHHHTQDFHFHFPLLAVQKAKSSLGPTWKSV